MTDLIKRASAEARAFRGKHPRSSVSKQKTARTKKRAMNGAELVVEYDAWREQHQAVTSAMVKAAAMFDQHPYLTRLHTTLSPEDMTNDPVFSFNPDLADVASTHEATLTYECGFSGAKDANTAYAGSKTTLTCPLTAELRLAFLDECGDPLARLALLERRHQRHPFDRHPLLMG